MVDKEALFNLLDGNIEKAAGIPKRPKIFQRDVEGVDISSSLTLLLFNKFSFLNDTLLEYQWLSLLVGNLDLTVCVSQLSLL